MTDLDKIQYAKNYIDKLANGINPLNDEPIPEDDLLNHVKISRCLFYVSEILNNVCKESITPNRKKRIRNIDKQSFSISDEQIQQFKYDEKGLYLNEIAKRLNYLVDLSVMRKIKTKNILDWLIKENLLYIYIGENTVEYIRTTERGQSIGLSEEYIFGTAKGGYYVINSNKEAQQYIVEHAKSIAELAANTAIPECRGRIWKPEQDKLLVEMYKDGLAIEEIAKELKRTIGGVRARLVKFGLLK